MKECVFDKENLCQSKSSGGHYGAIRSINKMYCAKKLDTSKKVSLKHVDLEEKFLKNKTHKNLFNGFIPKYKNMCSDGNNSYVIIENLKYGLEEPIVIDLKIGFKTANKEILILNNTKKNINQKLLKHRLIDKLTISKKYGYRAEGMDTDVKIQKKTLQKLIPHKLFSIYFSKDIENKVLLSSIKQLEQYYEKIMQPWFNSIVMVGSSILILYDGKNPNKSRVKIIDFANSYNYNNENGENGDNNENANTNTNKSKKKTISKYNKKFIKYYRDSINRLIYDLKLFYINKMSSNQN
jgi:hypothetical protein